MNRDKDYKIMAKKQSYKQRTHVAKIKEAKANYKPSNGDFECGLPVESEVLKAHGVKLGARLAKPWKDKPANAKSTKGKKRKHKSTLKDAKTTILSEYQKSRYSVLIKQKHYNVFSLT